MLEKFSSKDYDEIYAIMEEAFPPDERRTYEGQKADYKNPACAIYGMRDEDGKIKSFLTTYRLDGFNYLEHFATAPKYRNQGLGKVILNGVCDVLGGLICLEAELPETEIAVRRIEYYKRNGFFVNPYPYVQPPMSENGKEVPLLIMTYGKTVTKEQFEKIKRTLYKVIYKVT